MKKIHSKLSKNKPKENKEGWFVRLGQEGVA